MSRGTMERVGLDLGGTEVKAVAIDGNRAVLRFARVPSRALEGPEGPLTALEEASVRVRGNGIAAVGIGCPGMIDARGALVGPTPHLPHWTDFPVAERVASALGLPVRVENDANCAAWAEHQLGAARGARTSITVTVGTGVGCGIVLDGRLYRGAHGGAGEVGHLPIGPLGSGCTCGVEGCAEPWMSGEGLGLAARGAGLGAIDASELFALAERGNRVARSLVERLADRLGAALASAIHVIDPEVVVLGGGVSAAGAPLLHALEPALDRYVMTSHRGRQRVELAALGERAGAIGAALLARDARAEDGSGAT